MKKILNSATITLSKKHWETSLDRNGRPISEGEVLAGTKYTIGGSKDYPLPSDLEDFVSKGILQGKYLVKDETPGASGYYWLHFIPYNE